MGVTRNKGRLIIMANPYFNAVYYLQQNPDVFSAGYTVATAWDHYVKHGANEANVVGGTFRAPNPWFDVKYYLANNPDLVRAGITPATALDHFLNYGSKTAEDRAPNATIAAAPITEAKLLTYVKANADLQTAFGIAAGATTLTPAQENALITHFYSYGYNETRPSKPAPVTTPDANEGKTFTLTAGTDVIVGTAGDDTVIAGLAGAAGTTPTLTAGDSIDGGAGVDRIELVTNGNITAFNGANVKSIEKVFAQFSASGSALNVSNNADVTEAWIKNADVSDLAAGTIGVTIKKAQAVGIEGTTSVNATNGNTAITVTVSDATGTADVGTLALKDAKLSSTGTGAASVSIAAIETLNISAAGTNTIGTLTTAQAETINISGDGKLTATVATAAVKAINASSNTGGVTLTATANTANLAFTGGSGNDSLELAYGNLNKSDKLDGGAGTDTVIVSGITTTERIGTTSADASGKAAAEGLNAAVNFETIGLRAAAADTANVSANELSLTSYNLGGGSFNVDGIKAGSTFSVTGTATAADAALLNLDAATGVTSTTITLTATSAGEAVVTTVNTADGFNTVNLVSAGSNTTANSIGTLTLADNSVVNISGAQAFAVTTALALKTTVNAADLTGKLTVTGSGFNDVITVGSGGSALGASDGVDAYTLGAGKDVVTYTAVTQSGNGTLSFDTITSFGANDQLNLAAVATATTIKSQASIQAAVNAGAPADFAAALALAATAVGANGVGAFQNGGNTYVLVNEGAATYGAGDTLIKLAGELTLTADNFVL